MLYSTTARLHNAIITQIQAITSVAPYNECLGLDAQLDISNRY